MNNTDKRYQLATLEDGSKMIIDVNCGNVMARYLTASPEFGFASLHVDKLNQDWDERNARVAARAATAKENNRRIKNLRARLARQKRKQIQADRIAAY